MALKLSQQTQMIVEKMFPNPAQPNVIKWLIEDCGTNLPFCKDSDEHKMERIRFAVLKLSEGDSVKLLEAIELAKKDWRDVLVWSGFGNDLDAHHKWAEQITKQ
jgi:hypothetical protein